MPQILFIHSSAMTTEAKRNVHGSYTRKMARLLRDAVRSRTVTVVERDIAAKPPCMIDCAWIQAANRPEAERTADERNRLAESDELVNELLLSDVIVIGCPVYNFGVPAPLKAWVDNIVRKDRTFTTGEHTSAKYGLLHTKKVIFLVGAGNSGYESGGKREALNHADRALRDVFELLGVHDFSHVFMQGTSECPSEAIDARWSEVEKKIGALSDSLRSRWKIQS